MTRGATSASSGHLLSNHTYWSYTSVLPLAQGSHIARSLPYLVAYGRQGGAIERFELVTSKTTTESTR